MRRLVDGLRIQNVIARALRLGGGVNDELAVIAEFAEPSRDVRRRVANRAVLDASDPAEVGGRHFRDDFLGAVDRRSKWRRFHNRVAVL